jgi:hypothetical protein
VMNMIVDARWSTLVLGLDDASPGHYLAARRFVI